MFLCIFPLSFDPKTREVTTRKKERKSARTERDGIAEAENKRARGENNAQKSPQKAKLRTFFASSANIALSSKIGWNDDTKSFNPSFRRCQKDAALQFISFIDLTGAGDQQQFQCSNGDWNGATLQLLYLDLF